MASKGPKSGAPVPAASKPAPRARKAAAKPVVAPEAEKAPEPSPAAVPAEPVVAAAPAVEAAVPVPEVSEPEVPEEVIVEPVEALAESVAEAAPAVTATVALEVETPESATPEPAPIEPAPAPKPASTVFKKEYVMTVDPKNLLNDFNDRAKSAMEKSAEAVEELNEFAKGNVEALVESSKITAKGLEALSQEAAEFSRKSFETATATLKSMAAIKSPTDFFKLQSDFMRGAFDSYVAEASKATEAMIKLAGEAAQPISNRVALAAEKAKVAA